MARSSTKRAVAAAPIVAGAAITAYDLIQRKHAILRNFPVIGHLRYLLEKVGPELRQYIVTGNDEERPFSRDQRRWIYASAKRENNYFGFGTDDDIERTPGYPIIKHRTLSAVGPHTGVHAGEDVVLPSAKVLGEARKRPGAFRPQSIVNVSGMSFGSLSAAAVTALNRGVAKAGFACRTPGRADCRPTIEVAVTWSSRSVPATSGAGMSVAASTCSVSSIWWHPPRSGRSRSSSARARSRASADCSPEPR